MLEECSGANCKREVLTVGYLGRAGILKNYKFTTSCSIERIHELNVDDPFPRENYVDQRVVRDGHIITAKGRAFVDYAFEVFNYLGIYKGEDAAKEQLYMGIMDKSEMGVLTVETNLNEPEFYKPLGISGLGDG